MPFEVTIIGSNSALPAHGRHPTSQVLNIQDRIMLIDCGEGTQMRLERQKVKHARIENIFISHLHGDHFFGLIGLLTSYHLHHREKTINIFCPKGLDEIINVQLLHSNTQICYPIKYHFFEPRSGEVILDADFVRVETVKLTHRIPCAGFIFKEKLSPEKNIRPEAIQQYLLSIAQIQDAKKGKDILSGNGETIPNEALTLKPYRPRVYAYCTDTAYDTSIIPYIESADLLYHEATFDKSNVIRATETFHSTTVQAADIALKAKVKKLIIGHFSARYRTLDDLISETREVFPNSDLAEEGKTFTIEREN